LLSKNTLKKLAEGSVPAAEPLSNPCRVSLHRWLIRAKSTLQIFQGKFQVPKTSKCFPKNFEKFLEKHRNVFEKLRKFFCKGRGKGFEKNEKSKAADTVGLGGCRFWADR